jgi:PIN domain nuclease of toxin-antitoxin system
VRVPLLDTHAWIWWVQGDARLGRTVLAALDALPQSNRPAISSISLWEVATLVERGRLVLPEPLERWFDAAADPRSVRILPISTAVAAEVARLPPSFHRDPADRLIVATSRVLRLPVVTHDRAIIRSRLVRRWSPEPSSDAGRQRTPSLKPDR